MKIKNIVLPVLCFLVWCADCRAQHIISRELPNNPTSYIFKIKIADARFVLDKSFNKYSTLKFDVHDVFYKSASKPIRLWPEIAKKELAGEENKYDVYMQVSVDSSAIYLNKNHKPFGYEIECVVHFSKIDSTTTKAEIKVLNAKVHVRDRLIPSPPHFVNNPVYKKVKPTTIEEYEILQCFGKGLGVINQMPPLKL